MSRKTALLNNPKCSEHILKITYKCLLLDKNSYTYFFHDSFILFLDSAHSKFVNQKRFELTSYVHFAMARIFSHIEAASINNNILFTVEKHLLAALVDESHEMTSFER